MPHLLDKYLFKYEKKEYHKIEINAGVDEIYRSVVNINLKESFIIKFLFKLRGLNRLFSWKKSSTDIGLSGFTQNGFILLAEKTNRYIILGLAGKFWTPAGALKKMPVSDFVNFNENGFAKAVWSFEISEKNGVNILETETRIHCPDRISRLKFSIYWTLIRPFSGLIRKEMLRIVKKSAEKSK
ncbi:MAG: hypothetical protein H6627_12525 [Calditrichae bacterium]|nr:hypothetical protein [Calditrichota bacterium]MCB9059388.1 hypothetical protein [Calditrichia bacterium]